jgi:hypothetical protein
MTPSPSSDDWLDLPGSQIGGGMVARHLAPILIGTALAAVALAGRTKIGAWLRGFLTAGDIATRDGLRRRAQVDGLSRPQVRAALLGRTKAQVAAGFGPPATAVITRFNAGAVGQAAFWRADTWYYAVDSASQTAMAIRFDQDIAREVDFFESPGAPEAGSEAVTG